VARPAAGAGRQGQIARLLVAALLGLAGWAAGAGCASQGPPPGGPPRTTPAAIAKTVPESGAVVPDLRGDAVVQFDEVIDEAPGSTQPGGAITGLASKVLLSPVAGDVKVSWHRDAIHISPKEGWKPNRVYRLELLPGIADLRRNVTKTGRTIVFSTGAPLPTAALRGTALLWVEQRILPQAVIRAAPLPDTVAYLALTDSVGDFRLQGIPPGRYRVWAIQDQNSNRRQDRREPFDTVTVALDSTATAVLWLFAHDTVGPRVRSVDAVDSVTLRLTFSQPLDPAHSPDTTTVRVFALPDTTPLRVQALYRPAQFDSMQARARAIADSLKRLRDTTARKDTTARGRAAKDTTARARPAAGGVGRAPPPTSPRDTTQRLDTARVRKLLSARGVPYDRVVIQTAQTLTPGAKYIVRVRQAINLSGVAGDGIGVIEIPVPKPPPPAARDTTKPKSP
jgi:Bacterial Ig-like domain